MNTEKSGNLQKTIAIIIIAAIALFFILATVVQGFGPDTDIPSDDKPPEDTDNPPNGTEDTNPPDDEKLPSENENKDDETVTTPEKIKYKSYLTGLDISEEKYPYQRLVYICENSSSIYGASSSELIIEIPCENGETRYAVYTPYNSNLGKIGALAPTRAYISNTVRLFGGLICAYGSDDTVSYGENNPTLHLDLSKNDSFFYKESINSIYTRDDLIEKIISSERIDMLAVKTPSVPFCFTENPTFSKTDARLLSIPYSKENQTAFAYDEATGKYKFLKNGKQQYDMLSGENLSFDNLFVLFADSVTYETAGGVETVMNTESEGAGYYVSSGKLTEFKWEIDGSGKLRFVSLSGNDLQISAGTSYIAYYKSSNIKSITFE